MRRGSGPRDRKIAKEFDVSPSLVARWTREARTEMAKSTRAGGASGFTEQERDEWARKAMAIGRGGAKLMAKKAKVPLGTMHGWMSAYRRRNPSGAPSQTMVSSGPVSAVQSKPNGKHAAPQLGGFLTGLDDYINQIVDSRVEAKLKEILSTKSLLELMKGA